MVRLTDVLGGLCLVYPTSRESIVTAYLQILDKYASFLLYIL